MIKYFLGINRLKSTPPPADFGETISRHRSWCGEQLAEGRLVQAGKWGEGAGMAIVRAADMKEAESILGDDPLFRSGLVACEIAEFFPDAPLYTNER